MVEEEITTAISNSTSIIKMILEPHQIKKISVAINVSYKDAKILVDSNPNPAYILSNNYFVCNEKYSQILKNYGCPNGAIGSRQLNNIIRTIENESIDISRINECNFDYECFMKILDKIRFVSNETLSKAWGKLLKNEVESNYAYSMRTIEYLSYLSPEEAKLIFEVYDSIIKYGNYYYLMSKKDIKDMDLLNRTILIDIGFLSPEGITIEDGNFYWNNYFIKTNGSLNVHKLTQFGSDVCNLIEKDLTIENCKKQLDLQEGVTKWSIHETLDNDRYVIAPIWIKG